MISQRDLPILTMYFSPFIDELGKNCSLLLLIFWKCDDIFCGERPQGANTTISVEGNEEELPKKKKKKKNTSGKYRQIIFQV